MATSDKDASTQFALSQLLGIEKALAERLGTATVSANLLPASEPDGVPVLRIAIEGQEEIPVFVTASPTQVLCICYLWTEDEVKPDRRVDMLEAMIGLNITIPLSDFGRIGQHYVIYGSLAHDASADSIAVDVAMVADNAVEALNVFTEFLK